MPTDSMELLQLLASIPAILVYIRIRVARAQARKGTERSLWRLKHRSVTRSLRSFFRFVSFPFPPPLPSPRFFVSFRFTFASFIRVPRNHLANKGENDIGGKIARVRLDDTIFHRFFSTDDPHRGNIVRLSSVLSTDLHETCFNSNRSTQIFVYYVFYIYIYNSCFFFLILSLIDRISWRNFNFNSESHSVPLKKSENKKGRKIWWRSYL